MQNVPNNSPLSVEHLENRLKQIIAQQNLNQQRDTINQISKRLHISPLDCAAALCYLHYPSVHTAKKNAINVVDNQKVRYRSVRYRLDVGSQHAVEKEQIQTVLVQVSGVDKKRIGKIDIRQNFTLVELPDGMPADIFQLLTEATIGERKLAIKRVRNARKSTR